MASEVMLSSFVPENKRTKKKTLDSILGKMRERGDKLAKNSKYECVNFMSNQRAVKLQCEYSVIFEKVADPTLIIWNKKGYPARLNECFKCEQEQLLAIDVPHGAILTLKGGPGIARQVYEDFLDAEEIRIPWTSSRPKQQESKK